MDDIEFPNEDKNFPNFVPSLPRNPPPTIFHYTTRDGLLGITEKRSIWATNIRYLNDSSEFSAATEVALSVLDSFISEASDEVEKEALNQLGTGFISVDEQAQSYVISFSEDGDMLSQWRGYAKSGDGYSIGFDTNLLIKLSDQQNFYLGACEYDDSKQRDLISSFLKIGLLRLKDALGTVGKIPAIQIFTTNCILAFMHVAPLIKNSAFFHEREWRLIATPNKNLQQIFGPSLFRSGNSMIIPYILLRLSEIDEKERIIHHKDKLPIVDLVIGPSPHSALDSQAALALLIQRGTLANSCRRSKIPFRTW